MDLNMLAMDATESNSTREEAIAALRVRIEAEPGGWDAFRLAIEGDAIDAALKQREDDKASAKFRAKLERKRKANTPKVERDADGLPKIDHKKLEILEFQNQRMAAVNQDKKTPPLSSKS